MLSDTSPEMEKVWIRMWREKSPTYRLQRALDLSDEVINRSRAAIRRIHPDWSELECLLFWVRVNYGSKLADRMREHMDARVSSSA
jgi:hypothetical protein